MTATVFRTRMIRAELQTLIVYIRENEEDAAFREYCEGIIQACRAALGVISGETTL